MLLDPEAGIVVQGITGREASRMVEDSLAYGSNIVAGVTPGKGGQCVHGVPVYDTVAAAADLHQPTVSVISVPAPAVLDAALEGFEAGVKLCLIMTERVPRLDTSKLLVAARRVGCTVIGPNSLGLIRPGVAKLGTIGGRVDNVRHSFTPGRVAILSRSGGMTTEIASFLTHRGIGQSIAIGVGGDAIIGSDFTDLIELLEDDPSTDAVVIYGEPGGTAEEQLAERLKKKPSRLHMTAFLSGWFVDDLEGVRFGHAAVIVEGGRGSIRGKVEALREAGVFIAETFEQLSEGTACG
ncbi:MAG: succinate--CoA ligase subunit alpha [Candidatus Poribacteria bacterium]|nr:succinate--CoA ligase subunit alpha [Candidatus Poribacteria bacterium]